MASHVRTLGILNIIYGSIGLVIGLLMLIFFGSLASFVGFTNNSPDDQAAAPVLGIIAVVVFIVLAVLSLPSIIAGVGLMKFKPWARVFAIVMSVFHLFSIPIGTALGAYGLWVLLSPQTEAIFRQPAVFVPVQAPIQPPVQPYN